MSKTKVSKAVLLGIECGGTRSVALLTEVNGNEAVRYEAGPANIRLLTDTQLVAHFRKISAIQPKKNTVLQGVAIGMAGARTEVERKRIRDAAAQVWPDVPCYATHDLETGLTAAEAKRGSLPRVLVLSGTGSCCYGQTPKGKNAKVGGWGHILGDGGSGYEIGMKALQTVVNAYDHEQAWPALGQKLLRAMQLTEPNQLIAWVQGAPKDQIAMLAITVFEAWNLKDATATAIIEAAARKLAGDAVACSRHLVPSGGAIEFIFTGSILVKQPKFSKLIEQQITEHCAGAVFTPLERESAWGAVELARQKFVKAETKTAPEKVSRVSYPLPVINSGFPVTEQRNPNSLHLDQLPVNEMVELMLREDAGIPVAIGKEKAKIEAAVKIITAAFKKGGRLFYIGAGTSGRLGVLDASECPPTFRTPPEMVQGLIAGGQTAIWRAVEGAEDDALAGAEAIRFSNITKKDVVIGIAASGRTPYVWGALLEAKQRKAATMLICFNPTIQVEAKYQPDILIAPDVGPEILTGSTRLKAGTATKLILNMLTTLAMVKIGKVVSNLMIDMHPSNSKLRDRAARIVCEITGVERERAKDALEKSHWIIKDALKRLRKAPAASARSGGGTIATASSLGIETAGGARSTLVL